jgi:hypothetical protein
MVDNVSFSGNNPSSWDNSQYKNPNPEGDDSIESPLTGKISTISDSNARGKATLAFLHLVSSAKQEVEGGHNLNTPQLLSNLKDTPLFNSLELEQQEIVLNVAEGWLQNVIQVAIEAKADALTYMLKMCILKQNETLDRIENEDQSANLASYLKEHQDEFGS